MSKRFVQYIIALAALLITLTPAGVRAQTSAPEAAITVAMEEAVADFPNGVSFTLTATGEEAIVAAELFFRPANMETFRLGTPAFAPGPDIVVTYDADFRGGRMPAGVDLLYFWRLEDAAGAILETPERTVLWADDRFAWESLAGNRVTVYAYNGDPAFNQAILDAAEQTIDRLSVDYNAEINQPIRIWAYSSGDDFVGALAPNSESWIAGAAYPQLGLIISVLPPGNLDEVGRIVPHEVSHQVLHQATKNPFNGPPVWLDEGLAVIAQQNGAESFPALVQNAAANGLLEPIPVLNSQFPYDAEGALLGYAQSESIVNFIAATYGDEAIASLIAVFREGVSYDEAVQMTLGVTLDELDEQWRQSLAAADGTGGGLIASDQPFGGGAGRSGLDDVLALASGTLLMGFVSLLALAVGVIVIRRSHQRRARWPEDDDAAGETGPPGLVSTVPPSGRAHTDVLGTA